MAKQSIIIRNDRTPLGGWGWGATAAVVEDDSAARFDADLYSRNWAYIPPDLQQRLSQVRLLCVGTGLGSQVVQLAARTGFQRFVLCDGDAVTLDNLNRQAFGVDQVGHNKAEATAQTVRSLLPTAHIEVIDRFVDADDFPLLVPKADLILNTIDLDSPAHFALNRVARAQGKTVLLPLNLGWGGALLVFTPDAATIDQFLDGDDPAPAGALGHPGARTVDDERDTRDDATRLIERVLAQLPSGLPSYLRDLLPAFRTRTPSSWPYYPQLGVGAYLVAAIAVHTCVALVAGQPVRVAPEVIWCDSGAALSLPPPPPPAADQLSAPYAGILGKNGGGADAAATSMPIARQAFPVPDLPRYNDPLTRSGSAQPTARRATGGPAMILRLPVPPADTQAPSAADTYQRVVRPGTGLLITTATDGALAASERHAIAAYRLRQYALAGLYDRERVEHLGLREDPSMRALSPRDLHITVTDHEHQILCYLCMQSPLPSRLWPALDPASPRRHADALDTHAAYARLGDTARPLFPTETEYGLALFGTHPALRLVPLASVRELSRLVRVQEAARSALLQVATAETILAAARVLCDPGQRIEAILGCSAPEARRLLYLLGIPIAYAPTAPILGANLGGGAPGEPLLWSEDAHTPGRFWPYILATADLQLERGYFDALDAALSSASAESAASLLDWVRANRPRRTPRYVVEPTSSYPMLWTGDPSHHGTAETAETAEQEGVTQS